MTHQQGSTDAHSGQQQQSMPNDHDHHNDLAHTRIEGSAPPKGVPAAKGAGTVVTDNHDAAFGH